MKGRVQDSIETNRKVLELQPDFAPAHNNIAIAYLENRQYPEAAKHCDQALALGYEVAPEILKEIEKHRNA
jgi:tetratricopeptide (TPR) repeat protein